MNIRKHRQGSSGFHPGIVRIGTVSFLALGAFFFGDNVRRDGLFAQPSLNHEGPCSLKKSDAQGPTQKGAKELSVPLVLGEPSISGSPIGGDLRASIASQGGPLEFESSGLAVALPTWLRSYLGDEIQTSVEVEGVAGLLIEAALAEQRGDHDGFLLYGKRLRELVHGVDDRPRRALLSLLVSLPESPEGGVMLQELILRLVYEVEDGDFVALRTRKMAEREKRIVEGRTLDSGDLERILRDGDVLSLQKAIRGITPGQMKEPMIRELTKAVALGDSPLEIRRKAIALQLHAPPAGAVDLLEQILEVEADLELRRAAMQALSHIGDEASESRFVEALTPETDVVIRRFAAGGLGGQPSSSAVVEALLHSSTEDQDFMVRFRALSSMRLHAGVPEIGEHLIWLVQNDPHPDMRAQAANLLGGSPLPQAAEILREVVRTDPFSIVKEYGERSLSRLEKKSSR